MGAESACPAEQTDYLRPSTNTGQGEAEGADAGGQLPFLPSAAAGDSGGQGKPEGAGRVGAGMKIKPYGASLFGEL